MSNNQETSKITESILRARMVDCRHSGTVYGVAHRLNSGGQPARRTGLCPAYECATGFCGVVGRLYRASWQQLTGGGRWLLRHRRYFGLAAALIHTVHFAYIAALFALTDEVLEVTTAVFGGLAYVLIWVMALTSNRASQRRLGASWVRLHRFGMHYLWLVFMQAFAGVAIANGDPLYVTIAAAGLVALMLRIAASLRYRFSRTA